MKGYNDKPNSTSTTKGLDQVQWDKVLAFICNKVSGFNYFNGSHLSKADLEDVSQDIILKILTHQEDYDSQKSAITTWIMKIAQNCFYDSIRSYSHRSLIFCHLDKNDDSLRSSLYAALVGKGDEYHSDRKAMLNDMIRILKQALEFINPRYRKVIELLLADIKPKDMMEELDCSENCLRTTVCRARKELSQALYSLS